MTFENRKITCEKGIGSYCFDGTTDCVGTRATMVEPAQGSLGVAIGPFKNRQEPRNVAAA